jgi:translocation and assembly module TamB
VTEEKAQRGRAAMATKRIGIGLAAVLVLIVGAVLGALGLAQTDYAKRRLAQWIEAESRGADGSGVAVGAIEGFLPFDMTLRRVALRDRQGVWLEVASARLALSAADALRGRLVADALELSGVSVARAPAEEPQAAATPLLPAALPRAPIQLVVKSLSATDIDIAAPVLGVPLRLDATGRAALAPLGDSAVALTVKRQGDRPGETVLKARYAGGGRSARLAVEAHETGTGVAAALLDMPAVPALRLTLDLTNDKALVGTLVADIDGRPLGDTPLGRALGADAKLTVKVTATENGDVAADDLRLSAAQLSLAGSGRLTGNAQQIDARLDYTLPDLAPASPLVGAPVAGSLEGTVAARGALARPTLDLGYAARGLRYDTAAIGALDGTATVTGDLSDPTVALKAAARDLRQDQASIARLDLDATVRTALSDPGVEARFDARTLRQDEIAADRIAGTASAAKLLAGPDGRIDVAIQAPSLDARIATAYALDGRTLRLRDLSVRERGSTVAGTLDIGLDDFLVGGTIAAKFADLAPWSSLAGMKLAGALDVDARLAAAQGRQDAKVAARGARLSIRTADGEAISAGTVTLDADLRDVRGTPQGQAKLALAGGAVGDTGIKRLDATAEGGASALKFRADVALKLDRDATVSAAGTVARGQDGERLTLSSLTGRYGAESFALARPLDVTRRGAAIALAPTSLTAGGGRIDFAGRLDSERVDADVQIVKLPLKLAQLFAPDLALDGVAAGRLRVTGRPAAPEATLQLSADRLILHNAGTPSMPRLSVRADGQARGGRLALKATIAGLPGQPFTLDADLPLTLSAQPFAVAVPAQQPLKARLNGAVDLAFLSSIVPIGEARLSGRADVALGVGGTPGRPQATGTVTLADGRYENLLTGTLVDKIALRLTGDGSTIAIETLSATDGGSGKLSGTGRVALTPEGAGQAQARLRLDGFSALRLDEARATVSGDLSLAGTPAQWRLGGKLQIDRAELQIPERLPGRVVDLPVTFVGGGQVVPEAINPAGKTPPEKPVEIDLDVAVDAPARVFVRGRGLDSEWRGSLKIGGTASEPQVTGTLSVVRGTLDLLGKSFKLTRGTLTFTGSNVDDPDLDFIAETSATNLTAQVQVTGTVKQPKIELTSSPPYPQDEVLAQVLFGKGSGQLSPFEALQLAQAAASLTGAGTGPDITNFLRSATGLDVLRLEQGPSSSSGTSGGATLKVGKYVADNVFVSVNQGLTSEDTNVGVEIELTPNISVETSVGNALGPKIGVNYKIDY